MPWEAAGPAEVLSLSGRTTSSWTWPAARDLGYADVLPAPEAIARTARWYADNPADDSLEERLGDPFDYAWEDRHDRDVRRGGDRVARRPPGRPDGETAAPSRAIASVPTPTPTPRRPTPSATTGAAEPALGAAGPAGPALGPTGAGPSDQLSAARRRGTTSVAKRSRDAFITEGGKPGRAAPGHQVGHPVFGA